MLTIRTLGSLSLVDSDGQEMTSVLSQPKRFSILVYLAANRPVGLHRRDSLLTMFWPEVPESRARNALSQALSFLRRNIPPGTLVSRGVDEVGVDPEKIQVDTLAFQRALEDGAWAEALEMYGGDFLRGLHVAGALDFEEWMQVERDRLRALASDAAWTLARDQVGRGALMEGERTASLALSLACPDETTVRRFIEVLLQSGDRVAALRFYHEFLATLEKALDLEPTEELRSLEEMLRSGGAELDRFGGAREQTAPESPPFPRVWDLRPACEDGTRFVGREKEIARLGGLLDQALSGQGRVAFVTGEAGTGKTVLCREFCRRSLETHPELLAVTGYCDAHTGRGDAYRPFREILRLLTGDVEAQWMAGFMSVEQSKGLWSALPLALDELLREGPDLLGTFVRPGPLAQRVSRLGLGQSGLAARLASSTRGGGEPRPGSFQAMLFEQYGKVVRGIARHRPLLLVVEDLQWADSGSLDLLFQLGRHLDGSRILLLGLYRPSEVALGRDDARHPLVKVVDEFRMARGDLEVALPEEGDRAFFDAMVDSEPNELRESFRDPLFQMTRGHPLFTIELLRRFQDEGQILQDERGQWVNPPGMGWDAIPARIEALVEERMNRLSEPLRRILDVASVEGERFTLEVVGRVLGETPSTLVPLLAGELEKRHRLVQLEGVERHGHSRITNYRFRHILFQQFLYDRLNGAERTHLHEQVGRSLEILHGSCPERKDLELARHFREAGIVMDAVSYLSSAAERVRLAAAFPESLLLQKEALALLRSAPESRRRDEEELRVLAQLSIMAWTMGVFDEGSVDDLARVRELAIRLQDDDALFWADCCQHGVHHYAGEEDAGKRVLDEAEEVVKRSENPSHAVQLHVLRALNTLNRGEPMDSLAHLDMVEKLYEPARDDAQVRQWVPEVDCVCSALRALALGPLGYPDQALSAMREGQGRLGEKSDPATLALVWGYDMVLWWLLRDPTSACRNEEAHAEAAQRMGESGWSSLLRFSRGWCTGMLEDPEEGCNLMEAALAELDCHGWVVWRSFLNSLFADTLRRTGRALDAKKLMDDSLHRLERTGERGREPEIRRVRGEVLRSLSPPDEKEAERAFQDAIAVARRQRNRLFQLRATVSLSRLLQSQGRGKEARKALSRCYGWFTEGFGFPDLKEARILMSELE